MSFAFCCRVFALCTISVLVQAEHNQSHCVMTVFQNSRYGVVLLCLFTIIDLFIFLFLQAAERTVGHPLSEK